MTDNEQIETAIRLARLWHIHQVDKAGLPYTLHVLRVGLAGGTTDEMVVGFLHDILEDTPVTAEFLMEEGFTTEQIAAVELLTRPKGMEYQDYIDRVNDNSLARAVKIHDLQDNLHRNRLGNISVELYRRYNRAFLQLSSAEFGQ